MYIPRFPKIEAKIEAGKVLVIYGARQVGKSFLVNKYLEKAALETPALRRLFFNGEDVNTQAIFSSMSLKTLDEAIGDAELMVLDEAQVVRNVGISLKLLTDTKPRLKIIVTGSSSFELSGQIGEPLVGRMNVINLLPLWEKEIKDAGLLDYVTGFDFALRFGRYPAVFLEPVVEKKKEILTNIVNSYLLKDILAFEKVKNSKLILDLLKLLAYQIGNEVSTNEIANKLSISRNTVNRYLNLLEQNFIILSLGSFAKNLRNEIRKKEKYYFYDLGIRNALIENFDTIDGRGDNGALFENFLIVERRKRNAYTDPYKSVYFWRKLSGAEVDFVETYSNRIDGYEFSLKEKASNKSKISWLENYNNATWKNIHKDNYKDFII
ncbi:MAG: AAA family ATPase [bacterium]|nr:AAA family ATPase [bacterium]